jgi:hypothetical protein
MATLLRVKVQYLLRYTIDMIIDEVSKSCWIDVLRGGYFSQASVEINMMAIVYIYDELIAEAETIQELQYYIWLSEWIERSGL